MWFIWYYIWPHLWQSFTRMMFVGLCSQGKKVFRNKLALYDNSMFVNIDFIELELTSYDVAVIVQLQVCWFWSIHICLGMCRPWQPCFDMCILIGDMTFINFELYVWLSTRTDDLQKVKILKVICFGNKSPKSSPNVFLAFVSMFFFSFASTNC